MVWVKVVSFFEVVMLCLIRSYPVLVALLVCDSLFSVCPSCLLFSVSDICLSSSFVVSSAISIPDNVPQSTSKSEPTDIGVELLDDDDGVFCLCLSTLKVPPLFITVCLNNKSCICLCRILFCCSFSNSKASVPSKKLPSGLALYNVAVLSGN